MGKISGKKLEKCRACGTPIYASDGVLDLGPQYLIGFVPKDALEEAKERPKTPLSLSKCPTCHLLQLDYSIPPDNMYKTFWYRSSTNEMMRKALQDVVVKTSELVPVSEGDAVLDIGTNDGTLLTYYPNGVFKCGIDPAENLLELSRKVTPYVEADYFSYETASALLDVTGKSKFKHVLAVAMFYDLEDPVSFCEDVHKVLADDGVFVIQMNYLLTMLKDKTFDNVSHEHLCYYSFSALRNVLAKGDFRIVKAEQNEVNGGSFRVYAVKRNSKLSRDLYDAESVNHLLSLELRMQLDSTLPYRNFSDSVQDILTKLKSLIYDFKDMGKKIYLYGASTRGNTIMQALDLGDDVIVAAAERADYKFGLHMIGTWIPIVSEEEARKDADVFVVLPWHFWPAIKKREEDWLKNGGTFIIPLPEPRVVIWDTWKSDTYKLEDPSEEIRN